MVVDFRQRPRKPKSVNLVRKPATTPESKFLTYIGIIATFQLLGFITTFVYSAYFNRAGFAQSFVFRSSDQGPRAVGFTTPPPFGLHYFGDYLWVYSQVKQHGLDGYFGVSQLFLVAATRFPYYVSLIGLLITTLLLLLISARLLFSEMGLPSQLALLTGGFLGTQPFLLAIDRGQMHLLLFALLLLGLTHSFKDGGNRTWGAILIAGAISIKLTPIFFLLLFVRDRRWRELKISVIFLVGFLSLPYAYLRSGFGGLKFLLGLSDIEPEMRNMHASAEFFLGTLAYNSSFKLLSFYLSNMQSSPGAIGGFVYTHYYLFAGFLSVFLCWLITRNNIAQFEAVLLTAIASSLLIPIASGYSLLPFTLPLVFVITNKEFVFTRLNIFYCCYVGVVLMPKQIALGFVTFQDSNFTFSGIVNPSLSLCLIAFITAKQFSSSTRLPSTRMLERSV